MTVANDRATLCALVLVIQFVQSWKVEVVGIPLKSNDKGDVR